MMRYFAEVPVEGNLGFGDPGVVRCVFPWALAGVEPEYAPGTVQAVEVTDMDPMPTTGWTYLDGVFTAPPEPPTEEVAPEAPSTDDPAPPTDDAPVDPPADDPLP